MARPQTAAEWLRAGNGMVAPGLVAGSADGQFCLKPAWPTAETGHVKTSVFSRWHLRRRQNGDHVGRHKRVQTVSMSLPAAGQSRLKPTWPTAGAIQCQFRCPIESQQPTTAADHRRIRPQARNARPTGSAPCPGPAIEDGAVLPGQLQQRQEKSIATPAAAKRSPTSSPNGVPFDAPKWSRLPRAICAGYRDENGRRSRFKSVRMSVWEAGNSAAVETRAGIHCDRMEPHLPESQGEPGAAIADVVDGQLAGVRWPGVCGSCWARRPAALPSVKP